MGEDLVHHIAGRNGSSRQRYVYATEDSAEWVVAADLLVAVDSNYLVEAMLVGTLGINLVGSAMLPMPPAFDGAAGVIEADASNLAARIHEVIEQEDVREERRGQVAARVEYYHHGGDDGHASRRVADLMVRMARAGGPTEPPGRVRSGQGLLQRFRHTLNVGVRHVREERKR
jgi:hypothetical protein